jgi:hypothetical protein
MAILATANPMFQRAMRIIESITNANPAQVVTTFDHQYVTGMIVRLNIPKGYGMVQANTLYAPITVIDDVTFSIDIDTTYMEPFATPVSFPESSQYAQVTPIGEVNSMLNAATQNILPYPFNP